MPVSEYLPSGRPTALGLVAATSLALVACSDGGSGSSGGSAAPATGQVAVLFTDGPTDAFCQILAEVESIDLLGGEGSRTNVFTGPETVDVLDLRNYADFFAIDPVVPVGSYSKVRMTLSDLALVECDGAGNPEPESDWEHPNLPGNGKLDLNPRGTFEVVGGETMVIELDMDMEKSLHIHETGSGKWQFRPVVFVTIRPDDTKLVRVFGEASNVNGTVFELCPLEPASSMDDDSPAASSECLDVFTNGSTGIFDEAGSPVGPDAIADDGLLTAIGFLSLHDDADGDTRMDDLRLDAVVIELGALGTFQSIRGEVVSVPGNNDLFVFDPTPADDAANAIDVLLQSGTRIFALGSNAELTSAALQPGTAGEVDGVFTDPATDGEPLNSSLIVLDQDATPDVALTDAAIVAIRADDDGDAATRQFTVAPSALDQCVKTDADTRYLRITESADSSETAEIGFGDLAVGDLVDVYGAVDAMDSTCVLADTVQQYPTAP